MHTPAITIEEFKQTPEFQTCSPKMRLWLLTLISNGFDWTEATITAFESKDRAQAQRFSYAIRNWRKIRTALDLYLGKTPMEVLLEEVEFNLRKAKPGCVAAVALLSKKQELLLAMQPRPEPPQVPAPAAKTPDPSFYVGQVVEQAGKRYRVIGLDANGKPSAAEEII